MLNVICVVGSFYVFMIFMVSIMLMRESSSLSLCSFMLSLLLLFGILRKKSRNGNVLLANGRSNDLKSDSFEEEMSLVLLKMIFSAIPSYWVVIFAFINSKEEEDTHTESLWPNVQPLSKMETSLVRSAFVRVILTNIFLWNKHFFV